MNPWRLMMFVAALVSVSAIRTAAADTVNEAVEFKSVSEALASLRARDGNGTVVTNQDGWMIINEPLASAQWSFPPAGHAAYPALIKRVIQRGADGQVSVRTANLCEAPQAACAKLVAEFEAMNERIVQALQARGRKTAPRPPQ